MLVRVTFLSAVLGALIVASGGSASAALAPTYPAGARTGVARVDWALRAMQRRDVDALYAAVKYREVACSRAPGAEIRCRAGEATGTLVDIWVNGTCEPSVSRADETDVRSAIEDFVGQDLHLYAVYQARGPGLAQKGGFGILFAKHRDGHSVAFSMTLWPDGRLDTLYLGHCDNSPADVWGFSKGKVLLAPRRR